MKNREQILNNARDYIDRQRMVDLLGGHNAGLDGKRANAWCEYGYKEKLTFDDFYSLYRRNAIAGGGVDKINSTCWKTPPFIVEGDESNSDDAETAWETKTKKILNKRFWRQAVEADKRRLIGRYAGLLLHFNDAGNGRGWASPVEKGKKLLKVEAVWAKSITPKYNNGEIEYWQFREPATNGKPTSTRDVHPDRLFIFGDYSDDAIGFLEKPFNNFVNIEKLEGGGPESFLKNAARQVHTNFDKDVDLNAFAEALGIGIEDVPDIMNELARDLNAGNDAAFVTQGATMTALVASVPDPTPHFNINIQAISTAFDIPQKILVGNQTGERASTEDLKYFRARCQARREDELSDDIEDLVQHLIELKAIDQPVEFSVVWDDLEESSPTEKLENADKMADINQKGAFTGTVYFTPEQIVTAAGYEPVKEIDLGEDVDENADNS